ncbi:hypothetical protein CHS0354_019731 [Potamilus streckersoni]|uniref:SH3 domain-containing protein n=1 Tax=Potamilus streckersoni TaxID=2493646 RepID=A0AAE0SAL5_9BIVA|nr:hypothetical protein CHS0354_019731 [Potamilus streckersoni]
MAQCKANFDYKGEAEGCINLKKGDLLTNIEKHDNDWYMGENTSTGKVGFFPGSHVNQCTDSEPVKTLKPWQHLPSKRITGNSSENDSLDVHESAGGQTSDITMKESTGNIKKGHPPRPGLPAQVRWKNISSERTGNEETPSGDNKKEITGHKPLESLGKLSSSKEILTKTGRKLFLTDKDQNRTLKGIFGAITGVFLGGLIFLVLRYSFGYSDFEAGITVAIVTVLISVGLALSMLFRCVVALVIPNFFTGKGRAVILSIIFGFMLSHTVQNIKVNMEKVATSMSCIADLALNRSQELQRQLKKPLEQAAEYIDRQQTVLKQLQGDVSKGISPVKTGLMKMEEEIRNIKNTMDSILKKCVEFTSTFKTTCLNGCELLQFVSSCKEMCEHVLNVGQSSCKIINLTNDMLQTAKNKIEQALIDSINYFTVNVSITKTFIAHANLSQSAESIKKEVKEELEAKAGVFIHVIRLMEKFLSLTLILLFLQSFWYVRNYLARDSYDNIYITKHFKDLDQERKECGLSCVLPLKKKEKKLYIDTSSWRITLVEISHGKFGLAQIGMHCLLCLCVLLFDYLLYYVIDLLKRHGNVNIQYKGNAKFQLNVDGTGFVAIFYRELIQGLNINESYIGELNLTECLPDPSMPDSSNIFVYIVLYFVAVFFVLMKECALRVRRKITAYYYPRQEEARIQYLHKLIRHKRISFLEILAPKNQINL